MTYQTVKLVKNIKSHKIFVLLALNRYSLRLFPEFVIRNTVYA